jgi:hypothetical protein
VAHDVNCEHGGSPPAGPAGGQYWSNSSILRLNMACNTRRVAGVVPVRSPDASRRRWRALMLTPCSPSCRAAFSKSCAISS